MQKPSQRSKGSKKPATTILEYSVLFAYEGEVDGRPRVRTEVLENFTNYRVARYSIRGYVERQGYWKHDIKLSRAAMIDVGSAAVEARHIIRDYLQHGS